MPIIQGVHLPKCQSQMHWLRILAHLQEQDNPDIIFPYCEGPLGGICVQRRPARLILTLLGFDIIIIAGGMV